MSTNSTDITPSQQLCTHQPEKVCLGCQAKDQLMCRFKPKDLTSFLFGFLPFGIAVITGMILSGFGWYLLGWFGYWLFFFFVWEAKVLCSHCPYWVEDSKVLHCHANYGVFKIWPFDPSPMSISHKVQFLVGALLLIAYPFPFMILGGQVLLAVFAFGSALIFTYQLRKNNCSRCVNFSCPLNTVPKPLVDAYLERNPVMREAWEASGYKLGD
jgi:hypothetical protein